MIHQVLVGASPGDAVTNSAFELRALFREDGPSEIFARYIDDHLGGDVIPLSEYGRVRSPHPDRDVILFHASIGEPDVLEFIAQRPERLVLMYHNMSPAAAFEPYDPEFAALLASGRGELAQLRDRADMALAPSAYNAAELEELGFRNVRIAPLVVDPRRLRNAPDHEATAHHVREMMKGRIVLFVGQLLPHKRPDLLLEAYHALVTYQMPDVHLVLVGASRLPRYHAALTEFIRELNLDRAWMTGPVPDDQLATLYRNADAFVTASEHEGFCVPLLEAMAFDIPVIARDYAAIPETLGEAGVLVPGGESPLVLTEAMAAVLSDDALRSRLAEGGRRRLDDFAPERARATLLAHLRDVA